MTIKDKDGASHRIIGFATVLRREIREADPKPGDTLAVKFFGEKTLTKGAYAGRPYKHFKVAVRKAR